MIIAKAEVEKIVRGSPMAKQGRRREKRSHGQNMSVCMAPN